MRCGHFQGCNQFLSNNYSAPSIGQDVNHTEPNILFVQIVIFSKNYS